MLDWGIYMSSLDEIPDGIWQEIESQLSFSDQIPMSRRRAFLFREFLIRLQHLNVRVKDYDLQVYFASKGMAFFHQARLCSELPLEPQFLEAVRVKSPLLHTWLHTCVPIWSIEYIAAEARVSTIAVRGALKAFGLKERFLKRAPEKKPTAEASFQVTPEFLECARLRLRNGWSTRDLGALYGVRDCIVIAALKEHEPALWGKRRRYFEGPRKTQEPTLAREQWDAEDRELFNNDCDMSVAAFAKAKDISYTAAWQRVKRLGLGTQPRKEWQLEQWYEDLQKFGSIRATAKHWNISYPAAQHRAKACGFESEGQKQCKKQN